MLKQWENKEFSSLINEYGPFMKRTALRILKDHFLAEDIVQEVFIKYLLHANQIRENCSVRSWLMRVTENQCKDYLRTKYYQLVSPTDETHVICRLTPESQIMALQTKEELGRHICALPSKYQEILILYYEKELKLKEIEYLLEINISTIKTRLLRAKANLKQSIIQDKAAGDLMIS